MFSGIVAELGVVEDVAVAEGLTTVRVAAPVIIDGLHTGDSVSVNGICLTAVAIGEGTFTIEAMPETLRRSSLARVAAGDPVDLERAVAVGGRLDGHIVQGHVDGVGAVTERRSEGEAIVIRISLPSHLARYVVEKGSIAVDGVSLTVSAVSFIDAGEPWFEAALIPHTLASTVLGLHRPVGSTVNLEVDVLAKYVERIMEARA